MTRKAGKNVLLGEGFLEIDPYDCTYALVEIADEKPLRHYIQTRPLMQYHGNKVKLWIERVG